MNFRTIGLWLVVFTSTAVVGAQEQKAEKAADTPNGEVLRRLLEKVDQLDRDLKSVLKNAPKAIPENPEDRKLVAMLETPVVQSISGGVRNGQQVEHRLFVAKLTLINLTAEAKTVEASQITLDVDGNSLKNGVLDVPIQNYGINIGQQGYSLNQIKPTASMKTRPV